MRWADPRGATSVLYAALEDGNRRMQYRCRHLLDDQPIPSGFQYFTDARGADEALAILTAWLDRHPGGLVMLTLGKVLLSSARPVRLRA